MEEMDWIPAGWPVLSVAGGILQRDRLSRRAAVDATAQPTNKYLRLTPDTHAVYVEPREVDWNAGPKGEVRNGPGSKRDEVSASQTRQGSQGKGSELEKQTGNARRTRKGTEEPNDTSHSLRKRTRIHEPEEWAQSSGPVNEQMHASSNIPSVQEQPQMNQQWYPNWWKPKVIEDNVFYPCAEFVTIYPQRNIPTYPALLLSSELFRAILDALLAERKSIKLQCWCDKESERLDVEIAAIDAANTKRVAQIDDLRTLQQVTVDDEDRQALWKTTNRLMDQVDASNKERDQLVEQVNNTVDKVEQAYDNARGRQSWAFMQLDFVFKRLGVLPGENDIEEGCRQVAVVEPDPTCHPSIDPACHPPEVNPPRPQTHGADQVGILAQELSRQVREAQHMDAEFSAFRVGFDDELQTYIVQEKIKRHPKPSTAELEAEFGPIWLSRHQEMTRKKTAVDEAYYETEKKITDAVRAAELASLREDLMNGERDAALPYTMANEATVRDFGCNISTRRLKHIEGWLDGHDMALDSAIDHSAVVLEDAVDDGKSAASRKSTLSIAEGWYRRAIDNYERYVGRVPAGGTKPKPRAGSMMESDHTFDMSRIFGGQ